jgi:type II secretory pathway component PulM
MSVAVAQRKTAGAYLQAPVQNRVTMFLRRLARNRTAVAGGVVVLVVILIAILRRLSHPIHRLSRTSQRI